MSFNQPVAVADNKLMEISNDYLTSTSISKYHYSGY